MTFFLHDAFVDSATGDSQRKGPSPSRRTREDLRVAVLEELGRGDASQRELATRLGYRSPSKALREVIALLVDEGVIRYTGTVGGAGTKLTLG